MDAAAPRTQRGRQARAWGRWCERLTAWLLWAQGWSLEAANLMVGRFELDLLMTRGDELRLLEVKARRPGAWIGADTALQPEQRLRLQLALRSWLDRAPWPGPVSLGRWPFGSGPKS